MEIELRCPTCFRMYDYRVKGWAHKVYRDGSGDHYECSNKAACETHRAHMLRDHRAEVAALIHRRQGAMRAGADLGLGQFPVPQGPR